MTGYLQSYVPYFWQWEERGSVIAIPGGSTIVYTELLKDIVERMSTQGLPPFGSLLMAIIATNPDSAQSLSFVSNLVNRLNAEAADVTFDGMEFLRKLEAVPGQFKQRDLRVTLFTTIFENAHNQVSISDAKRIVEQLQTLHGPVAVPPYGVERALGACTVTSGH